MASSALRRTAQRIITSSSSILKPSSRHLHTLPPHSRHRRCSSSSTEQHHHHPHLPHIAHLPHDRKISITWSSGIQSKYHNVWLRDHCRCPSCYHPITKQRLLNTFSIPADIQPTAIEPTTEGLQVTWPTTTSSSSNSHDAPAPHSAEQQHISLYPWRWIMNNSYAPVLSRSSDSLIASAGAQVGGAHERVLWGAGIGAAPPTVSYEEVMGGEEGVLKWCNKIAQYGFSFVSGIPPTPEATQALIERIAFIRPTHYGGFWDFTSNLAHGDTAYTTLALAAHTDTTYFTDPAGLQLFHLLSHGRAEGAREDQGTEEVGPKGGESLLVDGFLAAKVLREVHPDAYATLSRVRVRTHSAGDASTLVRPLLGEGYPILQHEPRPALRRVDELGTSSPSSSAAASPSAYGPEHEDGDEYGELVMVRYNNDDRSTLRVREEDVEPFYDALRKWHAILTSAEGEYWSQLVPGTALIFDNHRVLHGRAAFVGARRLCGAYVSHDDYRSRLSVLRAQYPFSSSSSSSASASVEASSGGVAAAEAQQQGGGGARQRGVWDDAL
ncbi:hypothetical protein V8E36_003738 [Tilletia maclaganii]